MSPAMVVAFTVATTLYLVSFFPQLIKLLRYRDPVGVSTGTAFLAVTYSAAWMVYAIYVRDPLQISVYTAIIALALGTWVALHAARKTSWAVRLAESAGLIGTVLVWGVVASVGGVDIIGYLAGALSLSRALPQAVSVIRKGRGSGLAVSGYVITVVSSSMWVLYGALGGYNPLVVSGLCVALTNLTIVLAVLLDSRRTRSAELETGQRPPSSGTSPVVAAVEDVDLLLGGIVRQRRPEEDSESAAVLSVSRTHAPGGIGLVQGDEERGVPAGEAGLR